jgi:hypothetical protein
VENVNAQVDELIHTGVLRRLLAFTELKFSNSMIEARWRSLKHQWLFLHWLDSVPTVRRLVAFYVDEHNRVLPHSAFRGQTPDEMPRLHRWEPDRHWIERRGRPARAPVESTTASATACSKHSRRADVTWAVGSKASSSPPRPSNN